MAKAFTNDSTPDHAYTADAMAKMKEPLIETPVGLKVGHLSLKREASCIHAPSATNQPQKKSVSATTANVALTTKQHQLKHPSLVRVTVGGKNIQVPPTENEFRSDIIRHATANDKIRLCHRDGKKKLPKLSNASLVKRYQPFPFTECNNLSVIGQDDVKVEHRTSRMAVSHTQTKASAAKVTKKVRSCSCKNSRCLKLYCDCFASSEYCNPESCKCKRCQNNKRYNEERDAARLFCMTKNKNAFAGDKLTRKELRDTLLQSHLTAPPQPCSCSKSKCLRKYCGCFFLGFFCSDTCGCVSCANTSPGTRAEPNELMMV
jgi:Tesmin/TSO1-like CXC domain, cysteine-rich domain